VCLVAHLWDQAFLAAEMLFVLSKSSCVFSLVHSTAGELDDGDDHNQAKRDAKNGSNDSDLVPGLANEVVVDRWSQLPAPRCGYLWISVETRRGLGTINFDPRRDWQLGGRQRIRDSCRRRSGSAECGPTTVNMFTVTIVLSPWSRALHGLACSYFVSVGVREYSRPYAASSSAATAGCRWLSLWMS
jgi:hypothetical protein